MRIGRGRARANVTKASRHPEVNQEHPTRLESNNQILAASSNIGHTLARELCRNRTRIDRTRQPRVRDLDPLEAAASQGRCETRPHGLDFR
jgi:hypothetical protein